MAFILININTRVETFVMWNIFIDVALQHQLLSKVTTISYHDCLLDIFNIEDFSVWVHENEEVLKFTVPCILNLHHLIL